MDEEMDSRNLAGRIRRTAFHQYLFSDGNVFTGTKRQYFAEGVAGNNEYR